MCTLISILLVFLFSKFLTLNLIFRGILSTYKELCTLVIDLNRPELLYKFIQLANYDKKKVITFHLMIVISFIVICFIY